jgi:hypothetical protein
MKSDITQIAIDGKSVKINEFDEKTQSLIHKVEILRNELDEAFFLYEKASIIYKVKYDELKTRIKEWKLDNEENMVDK